MDGWKEGWMDRLVGGYISGYMAGWMDLFCFTSAQQDGLSVHNKGD